MDKISTTQFGKVVDYLIDNRLVANQRTLAEMLGVHEQTLTEYKSGKRKKVKSGLQEKINELFPGVSIESVLTSIEKSKTEEGKGIPYYDIYAAAGPITMYSDLREYITDYIHVPGVDFSDCDFCVTVWENSMKGKFNPGDVIICREVHDRTLLKPGASYFIITSEYKTVKDVYPGEQEGWLKLVPYNDEQRPFEIPLDKVLKIYHVRGNASIKRIDN
jgi:SOS-response transcriptional repressor LexA